MDFRDYTYVQAIAKYKTISKAAQAIYITQPSLSKFLQNLERDLGTPLFNKVNKQMIPTYAGEKFLRTGEQIFALQKELISTLDSIQHKNTGSIRLVTTSVRGNYVLPVILPLFKAKYPNYHLELLERGTDAIEPSLADGLADIAIYSLPERNRLFDYYHINTEEVILCGPHSSPYKKIAKPKDGFKHPWVSLKKLKDEFFVLNDHNTSKIGVISRQLLWENLIQPETIILRNLETCLALASRDIGYTFTFDICVKYFKNYPEPPVYLSTGKAPYLSEFVVATRKGYPLNEAERYLLQLVKDNCGDKEEL